MIKFTTDPWNPESPARAGDGVRQDIPSASAGPGVFLLLRNCADDLPVILFENAFKVVVRMCPKEPRARKNLETTASFGASATVMMS
jgi:hypothetical protein